jgi:hypothetical protein
MNCRKVSATEYLLVVQGEYLHLDEEQGFVDSCQGTPIASLPEAQELLNKYQDFRKKEAEIPPLEQLKRKDLLSLVVDFNDLRVNSQKLIQVKHKLLEQVKLENDLLKCVRSKFLLMDDALEVGGDLEGVEWGRLKQTLEKDTDNFRSVGDEMLFYFERLDQIENEVLKANFMKFVSVYLKFLDQIHEKINQFTTEKEAMELEEEVSRTFNECPLIVKKAKELREISKNTKHLQNIIQRIDNFYKVYDQNKESLKGLSEQHEIDIQQIEKYESEFRKIYEEGVRMGKTKKLGSLNQMKKSIESYLALRKKEKELDPLREYLMKDEECHEDQSLTKESERNPVVLGKREGLDKEDIDPNYSNENLKKVKVDGSLKEREGVRSGSLEKEGHSSSKDNKSIQIEEELEEEKEGKGKENSLESLQNSELSDADSECSNEYILKKRQKIRKLKSLIIRKKEEQNDLVNQSDERTSSFLHKKFSLMLLFFKLKVLGLDPETCSKTDTYLNTVKETDEMMKKTSLGKVTISELKQLIVKCEEMKYFSQGYQKFKRLQTLFKVFKNHTENLRMQFRGGLKITQEVKKNFLTQANLKSYKASVNSSSNGQCSIVLTRRQHSLFTKNSKKEWRSLNNKRKTKLRLGTDSFNSDSKAQKKKIKERIINAIYGKNQNEYCLCREPYELTSMIQFTNCSEWFHKECIKIPKYQMKRIKTKNCPACFFLHESKTDKFPHFRKRKIPFEKYLVILKTAKVLSNFILDERIDEIFYIQTKLYRLERDLSAIKADYLQKIRQDQSITAMWTQLHGVASLYIYLPVKNDLIEETLLSISKAVLEQLSKAQGSVDIKSLKMHAKKTQDKQKSSGSSKKSSKEIKIEEPGEVIKIEEESGNHSNKDIPKRSNGKMKEQVNGSQDKIKIESPLMTNESEKKEDLIQIPKKEVKIEEEERMKATQAEELEVDKCKHQTDPHLNKLKTE